jgi:hypothetical protein
MLIPNRYGSTVRTLFRVPVNIIVWITSVSISTNDSPFTTMSHCSVLLGISACALFFLNGRKKAEEKDVPHSSMSAAKMSFVLDAGRDVFDDEV